MVAKSKVVTQKVLTIEEQEQQELNRALDFYPFCPTKPEFVKFNADEEVIYGAHKKTVMIKPAIDDRFYFCNVWLEQKDKFGRKSGVFEPELKCLPWFNVQKISDLQDTSFYKNKSEFFLSFSNNDISSLWHSYTGCGLDLEPEYQREYVWDDSDKEKLIDSIFENASIGTFVLCRRDYGTYQKLYEVVDGKQRLTTIFDFMENKFPYRGYYFRQLSLK